MTEIPSYQAIDIILGASKSDAREPVRGFVVTFPDSNLDAEFMESEIQQQADIWARSLAPKSKYPDSVFAMKCWIHFENHGRFWTPR